jgi:uroporphyrinogen-III decarboxylase
MSKTAEELLAERSKRLMDALTLKKPDRIPIRLNFGYMLARLGGITYQELDANPEKAQELLEKWSLYFEPDQASGLSLFISASSVMLGDRQTKWPGYGLPPDKPFQYIEGEYMKAEDYDEFLDDPTNFTLRIMLPRTYEKLEGLAHLPRLPVLLTGYPAFSTLGALILDPALVASLQALADVARFHAERMPLMRQHAQRMSALGFPTGISRGPGFGAFALAPFDFMSDTLRGMRGIFLDMHRRPDKLLAAEEKARRILAEAAIQSCRATGSNFAFIPLHRGSDGFMSLSQFKTFYWPQLKGLVMDLVDAGIMPGLFYEGVWDERLHYLRELPTGKTTGHFQSTNIHKLKEVAGDVMCISGSFPSSLLQVGTPEKVREHTKLLCQVLGKDGGYIMAANSSMDECDPNLVKVWVEATKEYGVY